MPPAAKPPSIAVAQVAAGRAFFERLDLDVHHFGAMWHSFNVGQLLAGDLNAISRRHGISIADFHLLGALMMAEDAPLRAVDLAMRLNVSNAVLSGRVARLAAAGLLVRRPSATDRRAHLLTLTDAGAETVRALGADLEAQGRFVRHYRALPAGDRAALDRVMAALHEAMLRDFVPAAR